MEQTTVINKEFNREEFDRAIKIMKSLPPIIVQIQVYPEGYRVLHNLSDNSLKLKDILEKERGVMNNIPVIVIHNDPELKRNECRFIYSDNSTKVLELYKIRRKLKLPKIRVTEHKENIMYDLTKKLTIVKVKKDNKIKFYFPEAPKGNRIHNFKFHISPHREFKYFHWLIKCPIFYWDKHNHGFRIGLPNLYLWKH